MLCPGEVCLPAHHLVGVHRQIGEILGCHEPGILGLQIFVCDPTGLTVALSDVHGRAVVDDLG